MSNKFGIDIALPRICFTIIETAEELKNVADKMREHPESFIGIPSAEISSMRVRSTNAYVNIQPEPIVIASIGDFFVESENGFNFISKDESLRDGNVSTVPLELFRPYGNKPVPMGFV